MFCHVHFSDTALTEVSLGKYSCQYIDSSGAKTDKGFYLQISPEILNMVERNSKLNFNDENPIFVIDPYGRAVMYFDPNTDPKLILKDLKVLI